MSAGTSNAANAAMKANNDLHTLAPKFRAAVDTAITAARAAGLPAIVYEAHRSAELQEAYYCRGRTVIPPTSTVTNARSNLFSWHGFGLAVDVIHETKEWDVAPEWFAAVAEHFRAAGCRWGGEWRMKDLPHFQWGLCKPSPSDRARELLEEGGLEAVWKAVDAE